MQKREHLIFRAIQNYREERQPKSQMTECAYCSHIYAHTHTGIETKEMRIKWQTNKIMLFEKWKKIYMHPLESISIYPWTWTDFWNMSKLFLFECLFVFSPCVWVLCVHRTLPVVIQLAIVMVYFPNVCHRRFFCVLYATAIHSFYVLTANL